mgnify:CR=1 FL=1
MKLEELQSAKCPFKVTCTVKGGSNGTVVGFSQNDPLGVGGGIFPDMPVAYFEGGGWLLVSDLLRNYELETNSTPPPTVKVPQSVVE